MKILLLVDYYDKYLNTFYEKYDCEGYNYSEHLEYLLDDYFGCFVSYYRYFKKLGHDVRLIIGNDYKMQTKWVIENKINLEVIPENKQEIVLLQTQQFNPDIFFMSSMFDYYGIFLDKVSKITKNIFTWIGCPFPKNLDYSKIKCVISSSQLFVDNFKSLGLNSEKLDAAFDKEILKFIDIRKQQGISFIGGMNTAYHSKRVNMLEEIANMPIHLNLYGYGLDKDNQKLNNLYKGELWGRSMYQTLANSLISLNSHIDVANGVSGNMRLYETTGCGTLLMTEESKSLNHLFKPDKEIIAYSNINDLKDKINYFMKHPNEAQVISKAGQRRCLENHSYNKRIKEFENILYKYSDLT